MTKTPDDILGLIDEYLTLSESEENQRRLGNWEPIIVGTLEWHRPPRLGSFREEGLAPIQTTLQHPYFLEIFQSNLAEFYQEPTAYLRFELQKRIWAFRHVPDDIPLDRVIRVCFRSPFEASFFGVPYHFFPKQDPVINQTHEPPVLSRQDLDRLKPIDFYESGMMPLAHRLYEGVREMVPDEFTVVFSEWLRGPFGVALYVRGYEDMLADLVADPGFAHAVMTRVTRERQAWFEARARYLGQPVPPTTILDDEVDAGVIGPRHYRDFILPYEKEISDFHQRISYWHSCGNTGPMAADVLSIGHIELLDVSGWADLEQVLSSISQGEASNSATDQRVEIRFKSVEDLHEASPEWIETRLRKTLSLCRRYDVSALCLRADAIQPWGNLEVDIKKVKQWIDIARRVVSENEASG